MSEDKGLQVPIGVHPAVDGRTLTWLLPCGHTVTVSQFEHYAGRIAGPLMFACPQCGTVRTVKVDP